MKSSTKYLKIIVNIISVLIVVVLCVFVLPKVLVFFMPFVIAAIIALIANPVVKFLEKRVKIVRKAGTAVVIVLVISIIVFLGYLIIGKLIEEIIGLFGSAPEIWKHINDAFRQYTGMYNLYFSKMPVSAQNWLMSVNDNIGNSLSVWMQETGTKVAGTATDVASHLPTIIIGIIMAVLGSYFFLAEKDYVVSIVRKLFPNEAINRWNIVYGTMKDAVGGYFKAQFKIMGFVYIILLIGFIILREKYALLIALLIAILDFLPFFGTGTVMVPWAIIAFFQSDYTHCVGLLITWGVSQLIRQLIQPKLVGDSIGLEPIPTIVLLYIGFRVGGAIGLIIAVPVGMIIINLYRAGIFSNFVYSIQILMKDLARIRRFSDEELRSEGIEDKERKN